MNKIALLGLTMALGTPAFSEGFLCVPHKDPTLNIFVDHYRKPQAKRIAKKLYLYRTTHDEQTGEALIDLIATFSRTRQTLKNDNASYHAVVKMDSEETGEPGASVLGTQLQNIEYLSLTVQFSYAKPVAHLTQLPGLLYLLKRNGDSEMYEADCLRFLQNITDSENEETALGSD